MRHQEHGEEIKFSYTIVPAPLGIEPDTNQIPPTTRSSRVAISKTDFIDPSYRFEFVFDEIR